MDVEWICNHGEHHDYKRLNKLVKHFVKAAKRKLKTKPKLLVMDGSRRKTDNQWKRSFHIIARGIIMRSNCCEMKTFVENFVKESCKKEKWMWWEDAKGECNSIVDLGVYTKNRVFRLPLSHKDDDGSKTRFRRIVKNDENNTWEERPFQDEEDVMEALVTLVPEKMMKEAIKQETKQIKKEEKEKAKMVSRRDKKKPGNVKYKSMASEEIWERVPSDLRDFVQFHIGEDKPMPLLNLTPTGMKVPVWLKSFDFGEFFFFQSNADIMSLCGWCLSDPETVNFHTHHSEGVVFLVYKDRLYATCRKQQCVQRAAAGYKKRKELMQIKVRPFFDIFAAFLAHVKNTGSVRLELMQIKVRPFFDFFAAFLASL